MVRNHHGPAAVIGDESHGKPLSPLLSYESKKGGWEGVVSRMSQEPEYLKT